MRDRYGPPARVANMVIKRFWELIDLIDLDTAYQPDAPRALRRLVEALAPLDQVEVESFYTHVANCLKASIRLGFAKNAVGAILGKVSCITDCLWSLAGASFLSR